MARLPVLRALGTRVWVGRQLYVAGMANAFHDDQGRRRYPVPELNNRQGACHTFGRFTGSDRENPRPSLLAFRGWIGNGASASYGT